MSSYRLKNGTVRTGRWHSTRRAIRLRPQTGLSRLSPIVDEIRGRTRVAIPSRRPRSPSTRDPLDPGSAHESRDPLATDRYAVGGELGVDPRNPVGPSRGRMDLHDPPPERLVHARSRGRLPPAPRVVATGGDPQRATQTTSHADRSTPLRDGTAPESGSGTSPASYTPPPCRLECPRHRRTSSSSRQSHRD